MNDKIYVDTLSRIKRAAREKGIDAVVPNRQARRGQSQRLPVIRISLYPAGFIDGLPSGIDFFGRAFTEPQLIKIAYGFEQKPRAC